ncbi:hypothetical protein [Clostridium estertheticum]|nr:hypothetical protein [Clostridium estertheticum]MBX4265126.1 hypothetical protein [Clostridium estertheticum]WLC88588.1 hypothetical protein KTC95_21765 [Clostridium estertheticum]
MKNSKKMEKWIQLYGTCAKYGISINDNAGYKVPLVNMEIQNLLKKQIQMKIHIYQGVWHLT